MSDTQTKSPFRRLLRLAVTVFLNLALLIAVVGWSIGQTRSSESLWTEFWVQLPKGGGVVFLDQFGWVLFYEHDKQFPQVFESRVEPIRFKLWGFHRYPGYQNTYFHGGFFSQPSSMGMHGVKHWLALSILTAIQAIHHRRFITKLILRGGKHV